MARTLPPGSGGDYSAQEAELELLEPLEPLDEDEDDDEDDEEEDDEEEDDEEEDDNDEDDESELLELDESDELLELALPDDPESLDPELLEYRSLYQPPPLRWNAAEVISLDNFPPQVEHCSMGSSLIFWMCSSSAPHSVQR